MQLNKVYNKDYLIGVCKSLALIGEDKKNQFYEPAIDAYVKVDKQKAFLNCWREYFKQLMPLYNDKKKGILITHLIFGNEIAKVETTLYSNALFFRVSMRGLHKKIEINKSRIEEYEKENY